MAMKRSSSMGEEGVEDEYDQIAEFYDLFAENHDLTFYLELARRQGSPILDLGAGTGRIAIPIASEGMMVTALERSRAMLGILRARRNELPQAVRRMLRVVHGDMTSFDLGERFSLIIVPDSFVHLMTRDEQLSLLGCVREHLAPHGIFVLDLFPAGAMPGHFQWEDGPIRTPDDLYVRRRGEMLADIDSGTLTLRLEYRVGQTPHLRDVTRTIRVTSRGTILSDDEVDRLTQQAGLKTVAEYGWFDLRPYDDDSGRRILVLCGQP